MSEKPLSRFAQPVAAPGGRLMHSIPLKTVRAKVLGENRRSLNQEIPLIPFIDFLLCIVLFLLASFSASGEVPMNSKIHMPTAENPSTLLAGPMVTLSGSQVLVGSVPAGDVRSIVASGRRGEIPELTERLKKHAELWRLVHPGQKYPGIAILQIDSGVSALVVKSVFETVARAEHPNVSFMVGRRGERSSEFRDGDGG